MFTSQAKFSLAGFLIIVLVTSSINVGFARDETSSQSSDNNDFQDLLVTTKNLNSVNQFSNQDTYRKIQALVKSMTNSDMAQNGMSKEESLKALRDLTKELLDDYAKSFQSVSNDVLAKRHKDNILKNCKFDPAADRRLEELLNKIGSATDRGERELIIRRISSPSKACKNTLLLVARSLDQDLENLTEDLAFIDDEIKRLEEKKAASDNPQEQKQIQVDLDDLKKERKEKKEIKEEKEKVRGKIDVGLLLSGLANIAIGVLLTVYSGGTLALIGEGLISGGLAMVGASVLPLLEDSEVSKRTEVGTGEYERSDTKEDHQATDEEREGTDNVMKESGYTNVSTSKQGNYAVFRNDEGSLKVVRIQPYAVYATIKHDYPTTAFNDLGVSNLSNLTEFKASNLENISSQIKILFSARTPEGSVVNGMLLEHQSEDEFLLSVE